MGAAVPGVVSMWVAVTRVLSVWAVVSGVTSEDVLCSSVVVCCDAGAVCGKVTGLLSSKPICVVLSEEMVALGSASRGVNDSLPLGIHPSLSLGS